MTYLRSYGTRVTPQSEPIPGTTQVANNAGGFAWTISDFDRLERFLVLGVDGGTYYVKQEKLVRQNAECVERCIQTDGLKTVELIATISEQGRAPKNDPALFALAMCISLGDDETKRAAATALPRVARIGTHLSHFVAYSCQFRSWGPILRRAVANWFLATEPRKLLFQAIKYASRDGWRMSDYLRSAHPKALPGSDTEAIFRYILSAGEKSKWKDTSVDGPLFTQVRAIRALSESNIDVKSAAALITENRIPRECVPTELLKHAAVWQALLADMPIGALIRNLATMTRNEAIKVSDFELIERVCSTITDSERIRKARLHPLAFLVALKTYQGGRGIARATSNLSHRGHESPERTWTPIQRITDALDEGFYKAFGTITPMGTRVLVGVDVSGSMGIGTIAGLPGVTPRGAAGALAMQIVKTEERPVLMGFSHEFVPLNISPRQRLDDVERVLDDQNFGGTDCSLPMEFARKGRHDFDTFLILTDSETWAGSIHPAQALQRYRQEQVPNAKLVVIGMTATEFSIADQNDPGMLDVVGFDTGSPNVIASFVRGAPIEAVEEDD